MRKTALLSFFAIILSALLPAFACGAEVADTRAETCADGVNVTRWADLLIVYKDIPTTGQNEWGHNVVVSSHGVVTEIIPGGDIRGKDLAVPEGGMVVSATGTRVKWLQDNVKLGDYVCYDGVTGRIMVSATNDFPICFSEKIRVTAFNTVRYAGYLVVYDKAGATGTNGYGYEISVSAQGIIVSAGGNNSVVPDGGFVVSAIEPEDKLILKTYGIVGAKCEITEDNYVVITYDEQAVKRSAEMLIDAQAERIAEAKEKLLLIDYDAAEKSVADSRVYMNTNEINTYSGRAELYDLIGATDLLLIESKDVELRGVWYEPLEKNDAEVEKIVAQLVENGINQLCLGVSNGRNTIIPLPDTFPFRQKSALRGYDLLAKYVSECHKYGIELVVCVSVFHNAYAQSDSEWLSGTNTGTGDEAGVFYSPACEEFRDYYLSYLRYMLENYDIDGVQLDYVRYPFFDGTTDYGYDETTRTKFAQAYNVDASVVDEIGKKLTSHEMWNDWVAFKSGLVTSFVGEIGSLVREVRPDVYCSACLAADYSLSAYCQNGKAWIENGYIDAVYPMSYAAGIMKSQTEYFSSFDGDYYCFEGSGSYMSFSKEEQLTQVLESREYGADGISFFELGAYVSHYYGKYLNMSAFSAPALSPTYDSGAAAKACVRTALERMKLANRLGYADSETLGRFETAADAALASVNSDTLGNLRAAVSDIGEKAWFSAIEADIASAAKILRLSKDEFKRTSGDESLADESPDVPASSAPDNEKPKTSAVVAVCVAAALLLSAAVYVLFRKRSGKH